jgi:hypothetical protein
MKQMMRDVSRVIRVKVSDLPEPEMRSADIGVWPCSIGRLVAVRDMFTGRLEFYHEVDEKPVDPRYACEGDLPVEPSTPIPATSFRDMLMYSMVGQKTFHEEFIWRWKQITAELKREGRERSPVLTRFCGKKKIRACTAGTFRMVSQVLGLKLAWVEKQRVGYTFSGGVYNRETDTCAGHLDIRINGVDVLRYDFWDVKGVVEERFVPYRYNVEKLREEHDRWVAEQMAQMMRENFPEFYDPKIEIQPMSPIAEVVVDTAREAMSQMVGKAFAPGWEAKIEMALRKAIGETRGRFKVKVTEGTEEGSCDVDMEFEDPEDLERVRQNCPALSICHKVDMPDVKAWTLTGDADGGVDVGVAYVPPEREVTV